MVLLPAIGLMVWLSSALWVGSRAESIGRNPWEWFGVTLIFGVFALFVFWAIDPPREEEKYDGEISFSSLASYIYAIFSGLIIGLVIAMVVRILGSYPEVATEKSQSFDNYLVYSGFFISVTCGVLMNVFHRHTESSRWDDFPKGVSPYEFRIVGVFTILYALPAVILSQAVVFQAYTIIQFFIGLLFTLIPMLIVIISIWSLELGRPLGDLYDYVTNSIDGILAD